MANLIQNMAGMGNMTEEIIATDFLLAAKTGIKDYALALSETASPEVREVLRRQLKDAIQTHERIAKYMINKGYYRMYTPQAQIRTDINIADALSTLP